MKAERANNQRNTFANNDLLKSREQIDLNGYYGAEDIAINKEDNLYCRSPNSKTNFENGQISKMDTTEKVTTFYKTESSVTILHFDKYENLIA